MSATRYIYSKACFEDLDQNRLLNKYSLWSVKRNGVMDGVTLFGSHKNGAPLITYVKKYQNQYNRKFHEFDDYLVFTIARLCGANFPKVKLVKTPDNVYLFSRNIADCKNGEQNSVFFLTMSQLTHQDSSYRFDAESVSITHNHNRYAISKESIARIAIMNMIFSLLDCHVENLGVVINLKTKTAELALIDFVIDHSNIILRNSRTGNTPRETIANHHTNRSHLRPFKLDSIDELTYKKVFTETDQAFHRASNQAIQSVKQLGFANPQKFTHAMALLEHWKANLQHYKKQILTPNQTPLNRVTL